MLAKPWTDEDDAKLKELKATGMGVKKIAKEIGRPQQAINERWKEIGGGDEDAAKGGNEKKEDGGGKSKGEGKQKNNENNKHHDHQQKKEKHEKSTTKAPSKVGSQTGEARFTMGEWMTLQEDDLFTFGELQCLSEILMRDQQQTWLRVASAFYDRTGRRVHPDDIREKFEEMAGMR